MWQSIYADLKDQNFVVIAIAMDSAEAARPWIEAAKPAYPCLIDRDHHVADLYNMVNVPQATWIDEQGRIVRPPENAGSSDAFRHMDRVTKRMTAGQLAERERTKSAYVAAVRDWALKGSASAFVYDPAAARARLKIAGRGHRDRARAFSAGALICCAWEKATKPLFILRRRAGCIPESWNIWRQSAQKDATGLAAGPEFWARVDALGDRPYHRPIDMKGM